MATGTATITAHLCKTLDCLANSSLEALLTLLLAVLYA